MDESVSETKDQKKKPIFTHRFKALICARRVKCCGCVHKIENGEMKIQKAKYNGWVGKWDWLNYHMRCIFAGFHPKLKIVIHSVDDIGGFHDLDSKYQGYISALLKTYLPKYASDKNTPGLAKETKQKKGESSTESEMPQKGSTKLKGGKKKADEEKIKLQKCKKGTKAAESKQTAQQKAAPAKLKAEPVKKKAELVKKKAEPAKPAGKGKGKKAVASEPAASQPKASPKKARKRKVIESSDSETSSSEEDVIVAAPAKKAATGTKTTDKKTLSDDAKQNFRDLHANVQSGEKLTVADFNQFTVNELKLAIKLNDRSTTGNKTDLAKNLVDYMTNGCPPRCPECGGGRLKTRKQGNTSEYYCPGYMEDDEFVNCAYTVEMIARLPWKSP